MKTNAHKELMRRAVELAQIDGLDLGMTLKDMSVSQNEGLISILNQLHSKIIDFKFQLVAIKHDYTNSMKVVDAMNSSLMQAENDLANAKNRENVLNQSIGELRAELGLALAARDEYKRKLDACEKPKKLYIRHYLGKPNKNIVGDEFELFRCNPSETGWERNDVGDYWAVDIDGQIRTFNSDPGNYGVVYFR